jgi:broad specificity phosphatase PhoE
MGRISKAGKQDPPLTNKAIEDIITARREIHALGEPDIVLSSVLLRAIQTAHYMYPNKTVYIAPFIKEIGFGLDNKPNDPRIQAKNFQQAQQNYNEYAERNNLPKAESRASVSYQFVTGKTDTADENAQGWKKYRVSWKLAQEVHYKTFLVWLEKVLPFLAMENNIKEKSEITIAVVGHSSFMKKAIKSARRDKPFNVGIVELNFCYRQDSQNRRYTLHQINQQACRCGPLLSLHERPDPNKEELCNGVVFRGFPVPDKKEFRETGGGANCS